MNLQEIMQQLAAAGSEQTRKTYARHGIGENQFGVSYATLKTLTRKIKKNQALAEQLWATGNHDARILATMIADPETIPEKTLDEWAKQLGYYAMADALATLIKETKYALVKAEKWNASNDEWTGQCGWQLISHLARNDSSLPDAWFTAHLKTIEREIHQRKNRVRYAMNGALISIGVRNPALEKKALAVAKKIGPVQVDHGQTNCQTPDAAEYIARTKEHQQSRKATRSAK
jgi:3-methyladenine DNA glycosylase AlkD